MSALDGIVEHSKNSTPGHSNNHDHISSSNDNNSNGDNSNDNNHNNSKDQEGSECKPDLTSKSPSSCCGHHERETELERVRAYYADLKLKNKIWSKTRIAQDPFFFT